METLLGQSEAAKSPAAIADRVAADAKRTFGSIKDEASLDALARNAVDEFFRDSIKVTTFVPVLALRRVRDQVGGA
jgi:hypothetical protein